ncbi:putative ribonuclease H-like domain-containing protein [Tanacetum coccineum]
MRDRYLTSENENETESKSGQRKPSNAKVEFVKSYEHVKSPRESVKKGNPQLELQEKGLIDSGCSRHMTRNKSCLSDYEEINGGFVAFGGNSKGEESVLFTDTECVVLSSDFKLTYENHVLLKVPRKDNMYSVNLRIVVPQGGLTYLFAKATLDESNLWHRRLGHINFKTMNKLVRGNFFCEMKGIKREFSVARTLQQNGVAERKNRTLIEAARTMLADSKLPTTFWAEAVNTSCYVHNRVLVIKPYNKTPYELFNCKFDGKADEGFFVGYSVNSKEFRVFNSRTKIVEETLHITFLENKPNVAGSGPEWLFDIDTLTKLMNYKSVVAGNQTNGNACTKESIDAGQARKKTVPSYEYILLPLWTPDSTIASSLKSSDDKVANDVEKKTTEDPAKEDDKDDQDLREFKRLIVQGKEAEININSTNSASAVSSPVNTAGIKDADVNNTNSIYTASPLVNFDGLSYFNANPPDDPKMPNLEDTGIFGGAYDDEDFVAGGDMNNLESSMPVSPISKTRVHKDHPVEQIIRDLHSAPQTRRMTKNSEEHVEPKKVIQALTDPSWIEAMQDELLQNKKDERGIVVRNKARLVAQGYTQEEGIDYDDVFAPVARIEAIRLFLAYASFMNFVVYQMDVKSAFLYGKIEEEVYVCQPLGFEDPEFPDRVYKVEKALYGLHQAPRAWYETLSTYLLENRFQRGIIDKTLFIKKVKGHILLVQIYVDDIIFGSTKKELCTEFEKLMHKKFQMSSMGELTFFLGLQVMQKEDGIFISQDKYVDEILKKFGFSTMRIASTPMETSKPLLKDAEAEDVNVHLYRSMIRSLMYLTSSRPDIMFVVCACARFQVTPKVSHLHAVKRIFRYLKGQPKLGLWYPKDSPFDLEAYTNSDYAGASLDRKSTIGGCQFLRSRLISWQCKKQTVVANSTTEAEYVAAANCCGQVLWIQNQMLYYGYNFMNTKIFIDNESTICIVKNLVFHSKTKHIETSSGIHMRRD